MAAVHLADVGFTWCTMFLCIPQLLRDVMSMLLYQLVEAELLWLSGTFFC